jgi:hypothetical protein
MKKILFSLALLSVTYGMAGEKKLYHVNLNSGITIFDDSVRLEDNALYGVSVSMYERESASYGLEIGYERLSGVTYDGVELKTDMDRYFVNMLVDGEEELSITPYVLFGGGYENISRIYTSYDKTKSQAFVNVGLGFKYRLHDNVNITLEGKALGMFDTESVDYVAKLGIDFMFGNQSKSKENVIEALDEVQKVTVIPPKPIVEQVKKPEKRRWITPQVVESEFAERDQDKIYGEKIQDNSAINTMQESLKALKMQMAKNERALVEKLALLEKELAEKKQMLTEVEAGDVTSHERLQEDENIRLVQEREAKQLREQRQNMLKIKRMEQKRRRLAKIAAQKAKMKKIADLKKAKRLARAKKVAEQKALAEYKRIRLAKELEERRLEKARLAELKRIEAKKREQAEAAALKAAQERTDVLHVANGMAVFAD